MNPWPRWKTEIWPVLAVLFLVLFALSLWCHLVLYAKRRNDEEWIHRFHPCAT